MARERPRGGPQLGRTQRCKIRYTSMTAEISTSTATTGARPATMRPLPCLACTPRPPHLPPPCWSLSSPRCTVSVRPLSLPPCTSLPSHRRQRRYHRLLHSGRSHHPSLLLPTTTLPAPWRLPVPPSPAPPLSSTLAAAAPPPAPPPSQPPLPIPLPPSPPASHLSRRRRLLLHRRRALQPKR